MEEGNLQKLRVIFVIFSLKQQKICNIFSITEDLNRQIMVKLKPDLKYRGYVYFEPPRSNIMYQALNYIKSHNKFHEDIFISEGLSGK